MDEHVREWDRVQEVQAGKDHPRHPEIKDLSGGVEHLGGIEPAQFIGVLRPAKRRVGPERGRKPGVENIRVLGQLPVAALFALLRVFEVGNGVTVGAGPDRDSVAEPELARNAPVPNVAHPSEILLAPAVGMESKVIVFRHRDRRACQRFHLDPPLCGHHGFDHSAAAIAMTDRMVVGFDLLQCALRSQQLDDLGPRFCHRQAVQLRHLGDVHPAIQMEDCQDRKMMSLADVVIGDIMARGHLDRPGPKLAINGLIGHDRHDAMNHRQRHRLADQVLVTPVVGVDRDSGVADHGLRTGGRDRDDAAAFDRVLEIVELVVRLFVLNFQVRDGALVTRAPVDDPRTAVDEALSPELDEGVTDRIHVGRVHGEPDARPIRRETKPAHLLEDGVPGGLVPVLHQSIPGVPADRFFR